MEQETNFSLADHRDKLISNIQNFLAYKRANTLDFGTRLLSDFKVVNFRKNSDDGRFFVEFEDYDAIPHGNHYWVEADELHKFMSGRRPMGVSLMIDKFYTEDCYSIFEINLMKNKIKKPTIHDAQKFKGINIKHNNKIYKSYEVQITMSEGIYIDKVIRVFVLNSTSAESYIDKHTVVQNKIEIKNGITFEDFDKQEPFVRTLDALEAVAIERAAVLNELTSWFMLNMAAKIGEENSEIFLKKLNEIK